MRAEGRTQHDFVSPGALQQPLTGTQWKAASEEAAWVAHNLNDLLDQLELIVEIFTTGQMLMTPHNRPAL